MGRHSHLNKNLRLNRWNPHRRGATFIIVLGILSLLVLIASTMTYSTRLDVIANAHFGNGVQRQISGFTGIPSTTVALSGLQLVSETQEWNSIGQTPAFIEADQMNAVQFRSNVVTSFGNSDNTINSRPLRNSRESRTQKFSIPLPRYTQRDIFFINNVNSPSEIFNIDDESGKFNINALGDWSEFNQISSEQQARTIPQITLTDALYAALKAENINSRSRAASLARNIIAYKYGKDGQPGHANYDDDGDGPGNRDNLLENGNDDDGDNIADNPEEAIISLQVDGLDQNHNGRIDDEDEHIESNQIDDNRDGQVDEKGEGVDEADEFNPDPRFLPNGDDNPFDTIDEVLRVDGVTPEIFNILRKHFTVYSASIPFVEFKDGDDNQRGTENSLSAPLSVNTATAEELIEAIERIMPEKDPRAIRQYVANLIDYRDPDSVPTQIEDPLDLLNPIMGLELNVVINEVHTDAVTNELDGDDGQFIEIFNPWDEERSIDGYQINTGSGLYRLNGTIPPGGYLIITDDYNGVNDPEREEEDGIGSFYDIFKKVNSGQEQRILEIATFDIPNTLGKISLYDDQGDLIDYMTYTSGQFAGFSQSFQRGDPRLNYFVKLGATPFERNANYYEPNEFDGVDPFTVNPYHDKAFTSPVDVMYVYAGYVDSSNYPHEWIYPTISNVGADKIDSRIIDLFTLKTIPKTRRSSSERELELEAEEEEAENDLAKVAELPNYREMTPFRVEQARERMKNPVEYGRININTCSKTVLMALPEMTEELADRIIEYREACRMQMERARYSADYSGGVIIPFESLGELFRNDDIWRGIIDEEDEVERTRIFSSWMPCLTVNSKSFTVEYGPRLSTLEKQQQLTPAKFRAVLALDGQGPRIVNWIRY